MAEVQLYGKRALGRVALVDDDDLDLVSGFRWTVQERVMPNGRVNGPYARTTGRPEDRRKVLFMHQLIAGQLVVDHGNGYGLDNRRSNLRPATYGQNNHYRLQRQQGCSSRFYGVSWQRATGKWKAQVRSRGQLLCLGYFEDETLAAMVHDVYTIEAYGEFARLNFPELEEPGKIPVLPDYVPGTNMTVADQSVSHLLSFLKNKQDLGGSQP